MTTTTDRLTADYGPEYAAFLASIRSSPTDDSPRLIFADWLEEHGQVERGEFIRVQVELAARRKAKGLRPEARELPDGCLELADRECELLTDNYLAWTDDIRRVIRRTPNDGSFRLGLRGTSVGVRVAYNAGLRWHDTWITFRRGFPCEVTLPAAELVRPGVAEALAVWPLERVRVEGAEPMWGEYHWYWFDDEKWHLLEHRGSDRGSLPHKLFRVMADLFHLGSLAFMVNETREAALSALERAALAFVRGKV